MSKCLNDQNLDIQTLTINWELGLSADRQAFDIGHFIRN